MDLQMHTPLHEKQKLLFQHFQKGERAPWAQGFDPELCQKTRTIFIANFSVSTRGERPSRQYSSSTQNSSSEYLIIRV